MSPIKLKEILKAFFSYRWFPKVRGKVIGVVASGYGLSSLALTPIQLAVANPNNLEAEAFNGTDDKFYLDDDVISRTPTLLYTMSGIYGVGCLLFNAPTSNGTADNEVTAKLTWSNIKSEFGLFYDVVLKSPAFYFLLVPRMGVVVIDSITFAYYKAFGLSFIKSDVFITTFVGSLAGVFNSLGRIVYGAAFDALPYKVVMGMLMASLAILLGTLYFTASMGKFALMAWMWAIFFTSPSVYGVIVTKCNEVFESKYTAPAFGTMAVMSTLTVNLVMSFLGESVLTGDQGDYLIMFLIAAGTSTLVFLVTMFFKGTQEDKDKMAAFRSWIGLDKSSIKPEE